jgi:hypothetical protein
MKIINILFLLLLQKDRGGVEERGRGEKNRELCVFD